MNQAIEPRPFAEHLNRNRFAFGIGGFGVSLVYAAMGVLLIYFYTRVYGLSPAQAGTVIFFAAMLDAVVDPFVGWLASRTNTRYGRYRPYVIFVSVPMSLVFVGVFVVPPVDPEWRVVSATCVLSAFRALFQLIYMPYSSMIVRLSRDSDERAYIESWRAWFTSAGALAISFVGLSLVDRLGHGDAARGFLLLAVLIGTLAAASFLAAGLLCREIADGNIQDVGAPLEVGRLLRQNPAFWLVAAAGFLSQSGYAMILHASVTFFEQYLGHRDYARWALAAMTAAGLLVAPVWPRIGARHSKRFAWMAGMLLSTVGLVAMYIIKPQGIAAYAGLFFVVGCGVQSAQIMMFATLADSIDYGEWKTGRRAEAVSFAVVTFMVKASLAIGGGAVGWLFTVAGLGAQGVPHTTLLEGLRLTMFVAPAACFVLAAVCARTIPITNESHRRIAADLAGRAAASVGQKAAGERGARRARSTTT